MQQRRRSCLVVPAPVQDVGCWYVGGGRRGGARTTNLAGGRRRSEQDLAKEHLICSKLGVNEGAGISREGVLSILGGGYESSG